MDGLGKALLEDPETDGGFVIRPRPLALEAPGAPGPLPPGVDAAGDSGADCAIGTATPLRH